MSRIWSGEDKRRQVVYVIDAGTPLSMLVHMNAAASARLRLRVLYGRQAEALTACLPMAKVTQ
jgi:hypothetical protein